MSTHSLNGKIIQQRLIETIRKIHEVPELAQVCSLVATEAKELLGVDRVFIYELGRKFYGLEGMSSETSHRYTQSVENSLEQAYQRNLPSPPIPSENWQNCSEIGTEITKLLIPIGSQKEEWGILIVEHSSEPRPWQGEDTKLVQEIAFHFSIAVERHRMYQQQQKQEEILTQAVERATEEHITLADIIDKTRRSLDIQTILSTTTAETRKFFNCDRVGVYRFNTNHSGEFIAESVSGGWPSLLEKSSQDVDNHNEDCNSNLWDNLGLSETYSEETQTNTFNPDDLFLVCDDIYQAGLSPSYLQLLERYQARSYLLVPIYKNRTIWGFLVAYENSSPRHWETREINFMVQLGINLGIALQQGDLFARTKEQEQQLQTALETALKQQTETLLRTNEKERSLGRVIDKIRQTLDLKTIFQTAATEVRKLLGVEHIAIYRFDASYGGKFIFESASGDFVSLVEKSWNDDYLIESQGGRFKPRFRTSKSSIKYYKPGINN